MTVFKCKICGGSLQIAPDQSVATCDYCGTKQTLPRLDSDRRANLYDRANHFRRNNDFDKAMAIYEQILNEDTADAEAYWSIALCRYGIEYVEDPTTGRHLPTVNRMQFTSIFDDENYRSALANADEHQREIYQAEAVTINEIQKKILAISQKEEPFDVFICYKETDSHGHRTQDSVLATELYQELTREGFKVFFSRITLEDKLGSAYEPFIFAALHSAKVMVALGTSPAHFNAPWVKNEWSRYLALIKNGAKKTLIPAYRDMDPYDLPEEFSHLQAQDMSRLGFMQDLVRGVQKLAAPAAQEGPIPSPQAATLAAGGTANVAALLKRAFLFLEDGNLARADDFCEQVLNQDPENAEAYLCKLMIELGVDTVDALANAPAPFDTNKNFIKAVRFADVETAANWKSLASQARYNIALALMKKSKTPEELLSAAELFAAISEYKDAKGMQQKCKTMAREMRLNAIYQQGVSFMKHKEYGDAIDKFAKIPGFRDANQKAAECIDKKKKQEKRILTTALTLIAIVLIALLVPILYINLVYSVTVDGIHFHKNGDCYHVVDYSGTNAQVTIPSEIKGKPVTTISDNAFNGNNTIREITIPNSVTFIGIGAFKNCKNLAKVFFENPNGWSFYSTSTETRGSHLPPTDLARPTTAGNYLKSVYCLYYWKRK